MTKSCETPPVCLFTSCSKREMNSMLKLQVWGCFVVFYDFFVGLGCGVVGFFYFFFFFYCFIELGGEKESRKEKNGIGI